MVHVVILAGGSGSRLWPLSCEGTAKQFLRLPHDTSLVQQAFGRASLLTSHDRIWVVTLASQARETRKHVPQLDPSRLILEPCGRNTAAAIFLSTITVEARETQPTTVVFLPSDHFIPQDKRFVADMTTGIHRASEGKFLIAFGLKVCSPRTDFGYVEVKRLKTKEKIFRALRFIEKPSLARAQRFATSGRHFWNSGMFVWRSDVLQKEMKRHAPDIVKPFLGKKTFSAAQLQRAYQKVPSVSIDYALMEKSSVVEVVPAGFAWSDLGTWAAVKEVLCKDGRENVVLGKAEVVDGRGNLVHSQEKPVVIFGLNDLVVVDTPKATLVTSADRSRDLKFLLEKLRAKKPMGSSWS